MFADSNTELLLVAVRVWRRSPEGTLIGRVRVFGTNGDLESDTPVASSAEAVAQLQRVLQRFERTGVIDLTAAEIPVETPEGGRS